MTVLWRGATVNPSLLDSTVTAALQSLGVRVEQILVTMADAAKLAAVSTKTIQRLALAGSIPTVKIGRARRVVYAGLVDYIARMQAAA